MAGFLGDVAENMIQQLRIKVNLLTIHETLSVDILNFLNTLCEKDFFKEKMFNNKFAFFIPNANSSAKADNIKDCKAAVIETHSLLGPFFR